MRRSTLSLRVWTGLVYLFLFLPILIVVLMSFNASRYSTFPAQEFTFEWYHAAWEDPQIAGALQTSVTISLIASVISTTIGTLASMGIVRNRFRARELLNAFYLSPLITPEIITGIALLSFATLLSLQGGFILVVIAHVMWGLPFVVTVVSARLYGFDRSLEEAAMDLGADPSMTFRKVTLPLILPGILAGLLLAFTVSFDNFLLTYLLAGSDVTTVPIQIYSMIRFEFSPKIHALSTFIILVSVCLMLLSQLAGRTRSGPAEIKSE
ncbi:MAG: ABC transporter permease [Pseudomonadota bacterium]